MESAVYQHTSWPANGGTLSDNVNPEYVGKSETSGTGSSYYNDWTIISWDTSSLGAGATISAAYIRLYVNGKSNGTFSLIADNYNGWAGGNLVAGDWVETASPNVITSTAVTSITNSAYNQIDLTDLTAINKTGETALRFTFTSGTPGNGTVCYIALDGKSDTNPPEMVVTYTAGGAAFNSRLPLLGVGR